MKYRKKPVIIEAVQISDENIYMLIDMIKSNEGRAFGLSSIRIDTDGDIAVLINTLEGTVKGHKGDYIIRGVKGEFYPCRRDIFEETYEAVTK